MTKTILIAWLFAVAVLACAACAQPEHRATSTPPGGPVVSAAAESTHGAPPTPPDSAVASGGVLAAIRRVADCDTFTRTLVVRHDGKVAVHDGEHDGPVIGSFTAPGERIDTLRRLFASPSWDLVHDAPAEGTNYAWQYSVVAGGKEARMEHRERSQGSLPRPTSTTDTLLPLVEALYSTADEATRTRASGWGGPGRRPLPATAGVLATPARVTYPESAPTEVSLWHGQADGFELPPGLSKVREDDWEFPHPPDGAEYEVYQQLVEGVELEGAGFTVVRNGAGEQVLVRGRYYPGFRPDNRLRLTSRQACDIANRVTGARDRWSVELVISTQSRRYEYRLDAQGPGTRWSVHLDPEDGTVHYKDNGMRD